MPLDSATGHAGQVRPGTLVLADGSVFEGEMFGAEPPEGFATGEVVFNTVMSGYQEVISDPSYAGQIITFTTAHLGNYGTTPDDNESSKVECSGIVLREMARRESNWRSTSSLDAYLRRAGVSAIGGVDTRRLTRILRDSGAMPAAFGTASIEELRAAVSTASTTDDCDLVSLVTCAEPYAVDYTGPDTGAGPDTDTAVRHIVAVDCGIKTTIVRCLAEFGRVTVVPASTSTETILGLAPDGVFLSNGPGDPAAVTYLPSTIAGLLGAVPIFGICMGHQLLGTALGGTTFKLPFGHHGGNHPVRDLATGKVEITSQNHNYCVDLDGVAGVEVSHVNLNDGTLEGFRCTDVPAFGIQYHPEAGPGPHDSRYLFERFADLMDTHHGIR